MKRLASLMASLVIPAALTIPLLVLPVPAQVLRPDPGPRSRA